MSTNHTPGPWWVGDADEFDGIAILYSEDRWPVANVQTDLNDRDGEANAHLIAAAPDLLEALKAMLPEANQDEAHCRPRFETCETARSAIAKAEGRS